MRVLQGSFMVRRMRAAWVLLGCLAASVFITAALIAAVVSFYVSALPTAVRQEIVHSGKVSVVISGPTSDSLAAAQTRAVETWTRAAIGAVRYRLYRTVWSDYLGLPVGSAGSAIPVIQAAAMDDIAGYTSLIAGAWPSGPRAGQPIPVALPLPAATLLNLRVGSVLSLANRSTNAAVRLKVTGLFRLRDHGEPFWAADPIGPSGLRTDGGFASYGPAIVNPKAFDSGGLAQDTLTFVAVPETASLPLDGMTGLADRLSSAVDSIENSGGLASMNATTALPKELINAARGLGAARSLVVISALQLLLLAGAALVLAARLLASNREEEGAVLAARGAGRWQLIKPSVAEAILACAVAAPTGAVVGVRLAAALLDGIAGQSARLPGVGASVLIAAAAVFAFCLAIVVWPALRPVGIADVRIRRGRQGAVLGAAAAGVDVALVLLALLSVRELRTYSAAKAATGGGVDPVLAAAPALALAGLAVIPLRLLPVAARVLERMSARSRRLGAAMANWEISRRPLRQSGPVLLVILAVGTGTVALAQYQSWQHSVTDQAAFTAGAQVRVNLSHALSPAQARQIVELPGVTAAMPVGEVGYGTGSDQLVAIDATQAAGIVQLRRDLAAAPSSRLWHEITRSAHAGIVLPGRPERLAIAIRLGPANRSLGQVAAQATVQDATGATYVLPAGSIAADGGLRDLVVRFGSARYPLRLASLTLTGNWPPYSAKPAGPAVIAIGGLAESAAATGPFTHPFAAGPALVKWTWTPTAPDMGYIQHLGVSHGALSPILLGTATATQGQLRIRFDPGNGPDNPPAVIKKYGLTGLQEAMTVTAPVGAAPIPAIATKAFLADNNVHVGATVNDPVGTGTVSLHIVAAISQFPTVRGTGAIVVDQTALQNALIGQGAAPLPVTQWWLSTVGGTAPSRLPAGASVSSAAGTAIALRHQPLSAAPVHAAVAISAAAALLAAFGFSVSVAASTRSRRSQRALLSALGVSGSAQARLFCLEELMLSLPAAAIGMAVGIGLAYLMIPALTLTASAGLPVPPVLVVIPVTWVFALALVVAAVPVGAAALSAVRQPDPAAELRAAEAG